MPVAQNYSLTDVKVLILEQTFTRTVLRRALTDLGIRDITELPDLPLEALQDTNLRSIDLVIANVSDLDQTPIILVNNLRRRMMACNPFAGVILTSGSTVASVVQSTISCGSDGVLLKPYAPVQVQDQITAIIERRRPFIVTADYIGPERRGTTRLSNSLVPYFDVPNSLRIKALRGEIAALELEIDDQWSRIEREHTNRLAFQVFFLIRVMRKLFENPDYTFARKELVRLPPTVKLLTVRLRSTGMADPAAKLVEWLSNYPKLTDDRAKADSRAEAEAVLTGVIKTLDPEKTDNEISVEVEKAVEAYLRRLLIPAEAARAS